MKQVKQREQSEARLSLLGWVGGNTMIKSLGGAIIMNRKWGREHRKFEAGHKAENKEYWK